MDLDQIRAFLAITRTGSFSSAASEVFRTQPAVSLKIQKLENELGQKLLERSQRGVRLTEAGAVFLRRAEAILAELQTLHTELSDLSTLKKGQIALGASDTVCLYFLPKIIKRFVQKNPGVEFKLQTQISRRVLELILADQIDIGIVTLPAQHEEIETRELYTDRFLVVFPPRHPFDRKKRIRPDDLRGQPIVHLRPDTLTRIWIDRRLEQFGLSGQVKIEVSTIEVIKRLVEVGLGISILPEMAIARELRSHSLRAAAIQGLDLKRPIGLAHRRKKYFSHALSAFLAELERGRA